MSGRGGVSHPRFGVPHPGIAAGPHQPRFRPHPSPGGSGCARPRALGVQPRWDGEQSGCAEEIRMGASPDPPSPCVSACTALPVARTLTGTSGATQARATGT